MTREVAGSCLHGVPSFWLQGVRDLELELTAKDATDPPAGTVRLYRLPQSGWAVRAPSLGDSFMVDPVGMAVHERLWGLANFVVLTQPLDMTRRSDQLLMRMYASKERRPFLTHIAFHVPLVDMKDFALVEPGKLLTPISGVEVTPLGHARADGAVPYSFGYRVDYAHGPSLMFSGPAVRADAVEGGKHCALLVLSPRNPEALEIARAVKPDLVVVDDVFLCNSLPNVVRVSLANAHALQKALLPIPSLLLAPGEHCEIPNRK
jgi:hypothetical protein